ncbi:MAG: 2-oxoacid:acceptor oxidoreductase family protein [Spirochaetaceae bacterium]|jgi:indolepyruvate ferredoxin oxidoreductase beta subunit|nr:2-oxoacid:acceptor oxidoreductase family protein [Spirochaetaceae bacterium]
MLNIVIAGLGGQGTIFVSRLLGQAAVAAGCIARGCETIGMAQRGGSVVSHLRLASGGDAAIHSPLVVPGEAGLVLAFETGEAVRAAPFLHDSGVMLTSDCLVPPVGGGADYHKEPLLAWLRAACKNLVVADSAALGAQCGARFLNTALVGCALKTGLFPFTPDDVEQAIHAIVKPCYAHDNIQALRAGISGKR